MAVSPARALAFEILLRIEREDSYASDLLHSASAAQLSSRDHGLATELVFGVLRWRSLLDRYIAATSSQQLDRLDGEVLIALRLGAYQLRFLSRVPARAAIFESVELVKAARKRSAASFVNAVLRKIAAVPHQDVLKEINQSPDAITLAQNAAHPAWLVTRWVEQYGLSATRQICRHNQTTPDTAIHFDGRGQIQQNQIEAELPATGVEFSGGQLLSSARRVLSGNLSATLPYRDGRIAIQDEASQLVALLVGQNLVAQNHEREVILDCCAAPGNKTALVGRRNPLAQVLAIDLHPHRARLLQERNRLPNVRVVAADARHLPFSVRFDRILADVPCSGTGTLARNPEIKWRLRLEDLQDLQARQIAILKSALWQLASGGRLLYSTCSLEPEENEAVVAAAMKDAGDFQVVPPRAELDRLRQSGEMLWQDVESLLAGPYLRTIPGVHPCDGFFAALMTRK